MSNRGQGYYLPQNFKDVLDFYYTEHGGDQTKVFVADDVQKEEKLRQEAHDTLESQHKRSNNIMHKLSNATHVSKLEDHSTKKIVNDSFHSSQIKLTSINSPSSL